MNTRRKTEQKKTPAKKAEAKRQKSSTHLSDEALEQVSGGALNAHIYITGQKQGKKRS